MRELNGLAARIAARAADVALVVALAVAASGCFVTVEDKKGGGADPCSPNPCETKGVCGGWTATCAVTKGAAVCSGWKPKTGTAKAPEAYEAAEKTCDGKDNDCDGLTDEGLAAPADACKAQGICAGAALPAACIGGSWVCDRAVVAGFEATETTCDGKDNDCDGATDEGVQPSAVSCKRAGVCAGLPTPLCDAGAWQCHYGKAADFEEIESSCDGKDNDCDGFVDSNLKPAALPGGGACPDTGVCAGKAAIACVAGQPRCSTAHIDGWEPFEASCDGQDNDCDGKTDNVQGTAAALWNADTAGCAAAGVCKTAGPGAVSRRCAAGAWVCDYAAVAGWEKAETLCDGKDNDCDGKVDEELPPPPLSPCGEAGVCKGVAAACAGGVWTCDKAALATAGWEASEASCDGKDNDCDGSTDETTSAAANACLVQGVCATGAAVACQAGKASCDYGAIAGYQAATETACDGKDNDCDGQTDEAEGLDAAASGCALGVCAGKAKATCSGGAWKCEVGGVSGYESKELSCDGKDNDCDGQTDEDLGAAALAGCKKVGVCAEGAVAACVGGQSVCAYQSAAWQGAETLCDGKDNDCDGLTDPGLCGATQPCQDQTSCKVGTCAAVLGSSAKLCTASVGQCARLDASGKAELVDAGTTVCAGESATLSCAGGSFGTQQACPQGKPVCDAGACKVCAAGKKRCDPQDKAGVLVCAADGSAETAGAACSTGRCAGQGVCVVDGTFGVSDGTSDDNARPAIAALGQGFAVAWFAAQSFSDTVRLRLFDAAGTPSSVISVPGGTTVAASSRVAVAAVGAGLAVAWQSTNNTVVVRAFDAAGKALASDTPVEAGTQQSAPALAGAAGGGFVAWIGGSGTAASARLQRLDGSGKPTGAAVVVAAAGITGGGGKQGAVALAMRPDGGVTVAWSRSDGGDGSDGVWLRVFDKDGQPAGAPARVSDVGKGGDQVAIAANASGDVMVAWRQGSGDAADVVGRRFDAKGASVWGPTTLAATTAGAQSEPSVSAGVGRFVLAWTTAAADGGDLVGRDLLDAGSFATPADVVLVTPATGVQSEAFARGFGDGRVVIGWRERSSALAKGTLQAKFR